MLLNLLTNAIMYTPRAASARGRARPRTFSGRRFCDVEIAICEPTDFLLRPFDHLEVLLRIGNLLEMRRLHQQLDNQRAAFEEALRDRSLEWREAQTLAGVH